MVNQIMEKTSEIKFSLILLIALALHVVIAVSIIIPNYHNLNDIDRLFSKRGIGGRDIIVNINQDKRRDYTKKTLLSDKDSTAKGFLTKLSGNRWLNNSLDFKLLKGTTSTGKSVRKVKVSKYEKIILASLSEIVIQLQKYLPKDKFAGKSGIADFIKIPDKNDVTMKNAIYYTNSGLFSFNTAKFKNFKYFKAMKDKIASNWFLPGMANLAFGAYNPITGSFSTARGYERYMTIPSHRIKLYFTMNRQGDVRKVVLLDSMGYQQLEVSCIEAIQLSKNFGKVPDDIKGEIIVIPFIFGFYVY